MSATVIDGKALAAKVKEEVRVKALKLSARPGLAVIIVGDNPASRVYVNGKKKDCEECGFYSEEHALPGTAKQEELLALIEQLNERADIDGILVQLPLPTHLNEAKALELIKPEKDVDGFHIFNTGKLFNGLEGVIACTPKGAMEMIKSTGLSISGKEAVVVGRSNIVGKPMAMLLLQESATVTVCHSRTPDIAAHTRRADILVVAVGKPGLITADMVKPGAVVIDVGINRVDGKVVGDVDFESVSQVAGYITPVPGGVGRMTIAMLLDNTVKAAAGKTHA